jgi:hypothetical protein
LNAGAGQQQDLLLAQARNNHGYDAIPNWVIDCFSRYGCNVSSWVFGSAQCQACNTAVVNCFRNSNLGPSRCCRADNYGRPIIG